MHSQITWVIKSSKLCNLRCTYCYELNELADRARINEANFTALFEKCRDVSSHFGAVPKFCWHGGEPLLLPPAYYENMFQVQRQVFGEVPVQNVVQTNLTVLGERQISLLRLFDHVSISLDLFGGHRVTKDGRDAQYRVLENLAALTNAGVRMGAIAVLTTENIPRVREIFDFYNSARISFRVLPYYRRADREQQVKHAIGREELVRAYEILMDAWFTDGQGISILPIADYVRAAVIQTSGIESARFCYSKKQREFVYVVNTNMDVYSVADTYSPFHVHGNLLTHNVEELIASPGRARAVTESEKRTSAVCLSCEFYGACSGWPVAEATEVEREIMNASGEMCLAASALIARAAAWLKSDEALLRSVGTPTREIYEYV